MSIVVCLRYYFISACLILVSTKNGILCLLLTTILMIGLTSFNNWMTTCLCSCDMNAICDLACALHGKCASVNNVITDMAKHILNIKRNLKSHCNHLTKNIKISSNMYTDLFKPFNTQTILTTIIDIFKAMLKVYRFV